jgi:predicted ATPase
MDSASSKRRRRTSLHSPKPKVSLIHGVIPRSSTRLLIYRGNGNFARLAKPDGIQFHDRSLVCTVALAECLGHPVPDLLSRQLERVETEAIFQKRVFFIRNLGFITPTEARRISFEESLRFERIHEETYHSFGFRIVFVEAGSVLDRAAAIKAALY